MQIDFCRILPKKSSKKNSSQKILLKISQQIQKISKQFLKNFLRFWKYPIPYIALGGRKPFRACFNKYYDFFFNCSKLRIKSCFETRSSSFSAAQTEKNYWKKIRETNWWKHLMNSLLVGNGLLCVDGVVDGNYDAIGNRVL